MEDPKGKFALAASRDAIFGQRFDRGDAEPRRVENTRALQFTALDRAANAALGDLQYERRLGRQQR